MDEDAAEGIIKSLIPQASSNIDAAGHGTQLREPRCSLFFGNLRPRDRHYQSVQNVGTVVDLDLVKVEKDKGCGEGDAFVAVDEGVLAAEVEEIRRSLCYRSVVE